MTPDEAHALSVDAATATSDELRQLFDDAGTTSRPDGWLIAAYRRAAIAMRGHLLEADYIVALLDALRAEMRRRWLDEFDLAFDLGVTQARKELDAYGFAFVASLQRAAFVTGAAAALLGLLDAQLAKVRVLVLTRRARDAEILGAGGRVGLFTPGPLVLQNADWLVRVATGAHDDTAAKSAPGRFEKQAVATIDERTTDCCLRVHGQIQPMAGEFLLTGVPRYADRMPAPPFHWFCRTAMALVLAGRGNNDLTRRMIAAAAAELEARARTGRRVEIHPSFSFSGRAG